MSAYNYGFQTGQGFNPYLLRQLRDVVGSENTGAMKVSNLGFINLLNSQRKMLNLTVPNNNGAIQYVQVKMDQRYTHQMTQTSDTCSTGYQNPYVEISVPLNIYRQLPIYLADELIAQYEYDANTTQSLGLPPTPVMMEVLNQIYAAANAIIEGINIDLQNQLVFGVNNRTGSAAASTINFAVDTTQLPLNNGMTQILTDTITNEFAGGKPQMFGNGLALDYFMQQQAKSGMFASNGLITKIEAGMVDFFYDIDSTTILGANEAALISPDAVQLVEYARWEGIRGGSRGNTHLGSIVLPMPANALPNGQTNFVPKKFDLQLNYINCPEDVAQIVDYYGAPISNSFRGYQVIVSSYVGLFQIPTTQYRAGDNLYGTNGVLRYTFTNI
jgi:hypothetical protein